MRANVTRSVPWLFLALVIVIASGIAAKIEAKTTAREATASAQVAMRTLIARQCDRNQVNRAWQRVRARAVPRGQRGVYYVRLSNRYFPIVNCAATYDVGNVSGHTVYLSAEMDTCFMRLTSRGYWTDAYGSAHPPTTAPSQLRHICATR